MTPSTVTPHQVACCCTQSPKPSVTATHTIFQLMRTGIQATCPFWLLHGCLGASAEKCVYGSDRRLRSLCATTDCLIYHHNMWCAIEATGSHRSVASSQASIQATTKPLFPFSAADNLSAIFFQISKRCTLKGYKQPKQIQEGC